MRLAAEPQVLLLTYVQYYLTLRVVWNRGLDAADGGGEAGRSAPLETLTSQATPPSATWRSRPLPEPSRTLRRWLSPLALALALGGVYGATLLPGAGYSPDTAEFQFSGHLLCVTHPTGYPAYLLLNYAFSRLAPIGSVAFRANLFSAICSVLACLVIRRLLQRLGARDAIATASSLALGFTPTFWRLSVVAEVYSLHALLLALVAHGLLRWRQTRERRALIVACGLYVFSFGNHLTSITLLPAVAFIVIATHGRVLFDRRSAAPVAGLITLGLLPYAYPIWRSLDPTTPYVSVPVTNLAELWGYATGAMFRGAMFPFTPAQLLFERVPLFARHWWADCGVLLPLAALGVVGLKDRVAGAFLGLIFLGQLAFALNYDIADIDVYLIPVYIITGVAAGLGLEWLFSRRWVHRVPAVACFALPLVLCLLHWDRVEVAKGADKAQPMREIVTATRDRALIIARYNDFMYLLYYTLAERLGGPSLFLGTEIPLEEIVAYVGQDRPVYLAHTRQWAPPGLPVYCTYLSLRPALRAAGLQLKVVRPGVFQIDRNHGISTAPMAQAVYEDGSGAPRPGEAQADQ